MTLYITVLLASSALALLAQQVRRRDHLDPASSPRAFSVLVLPVLLLLAMVGALRWRVGEDYDTYYRSFPKFVEELNQGVPVWGEPGIRVLAWLAHRFNGDGAVMLAMASILTVGLSVYTLWRWSPSFVLGIIIYILSGGWHGSFNGVRQFLAAAILFAGHRFIISRRLVPWVAVVACASLFHVSAVVGLLMYLVPLRRLLVKGTAIIFAVSVAILYGTSLVLSLLYSVSYDSDMVSGYALVTVNPLRVAFAFVPAMIMIIFPASSLLRQPGNWFYGNMLIVHAAGALAALNSALLARIAIYPSAFLALSLPYVLALNNKVDRFVVRCVVISLFFVFWYVGVSGTDNLVNFQWLFDR